MHTGPIQADVMLCSLPDTSAQTPYLTSHVTPNDADTQQVWSQSCRDKFIAELTSSYL